MKVFEFGTVKSVEVIKVIMVRTLMGGNNPDGVGSDVVTYWDMGGNKIGEYDPRKGNPFPIEPTIEED
ncbi:MAG TPA: hypothetical protein DD413_07585 [Ruminococcus sp.]|nr:hypothetical protein [Ruminococcus sp.]